MENYLQYRPKEFQFVAGWVRNWFSNFAESPFELNDIRWRSVENYYQAMKTLDVSIRQRIAYMTPAQAKKAGRNLLIRPDWENIKYDVMITALRAKFSNEDWTKKLLATENEVLIEWNNWNDKIWGVSIKDNLGENKLGKALMKIREELNEKYLLKDTSLGKFLVSKQQTNIY